jgi:hypothetical protein
MCVLPPEVTSVTVGVLARLIRTSDAYDAVIDFDADFLTLREGD